MSCIKQTSMVFVLITLTALVWASAADELTEPNEVVQAEAAAAAEDEQEVIIDRDVPLQRIDDKPERRERGDRDRRSPPRRQQNRIDELEQRIDRWRREREKETLSAATHIIDRLEEELARVRRQQHQEQSQLQAHLRERKAARRRPSVEDHRPHPEIAERIEHMQAAVRHLVEAGLPHIAEQVEQQVIAARRELESRRHRIHHESDREKQSAIHFYP